MKPKRRKAIRIQKTGRSGSAFEVEALESRRLLAAVLIDDQFYAGVHENFWSWDPLTLGPGRHRIHVTALGPRLNLAGPSAEFVVPG